MPRLAATQQRPAESPAQTAKPSSGLGPRNSENTAAARIDSTAAPPKISAGLPVASCSSLRPAALCQAFPNSGGAYQSPPSMNAEIPAAMMASQFSSIPVPPYRSLRFRRFRDPLQHVEMLAQDGDVPVEMAKVAEGAGLHHRA